MVPLLQCAMSLLSTLTRLSKMSPRDMYQNGFPMKLRYFMLNCVNHEVLPNMMVINISEVTAVIPISSVGT